MGNIFGQFQSPATMPDLHESSMTLGKVLPSNGLPVHLAGRARWEVDVAERDLANLKIDDSATWNCFDILYGEVIVDQGTGAISTFCIVFELTVTNRFDSFVVFRTRCVVVDGFFKIPLVHRSIIFCVVFIISTQ